MKYWLLALGIFISAAANAQFGLYAQGGGNYTDVIVTRDPGGTVKGGPGNGWQLSGGAEYHTQFGFFLFLEAGVSHQSFTKDSSGVKGERAGESHYTYSPLFLNFPFGIGYQLNFNDRLALRVYGGITAQTGIGGKITGSSTRYSVDTLTNEYTVIRSEEVNRKLNFGRSIAIQSEFTSDLANAIWGFNLGAGLNITKAFELNVFYTGTFTNILPGGDAAPEINKLNALSLNLKYYFIRSYYNAKPKYH